MLYEILYGSLVIHVTLLLVVTVVKHCFLIIYCFCDEFEGGCFIIVRKTRCVGASGCYKVLDINKTVSPNKMNERYRSSKAYKYINVIIVRVIIDNCTHCQLNANYKSKLSFLYLYSPGIVVK